MTDPTELQAPEPKCECYVSRNLNTGKDENTLSRTCLVHQAEATTFYAEWDRKCAEASTVTKMLRARPTNLHDYQGCANDPTMVPAPLVWAVPDLDVTEEDWTEAYRCCGFTIRMPEADQVARDTARLVCRDRQLTEAYAHLNKQHADIYELRQSYASPCGQQSHFSNVAGRIGDFSGMTIFCVNCKQQDDIARAECNLSVLKSAIGQKLGISDAEIERRIHEEGGFPLFFGKELRELEAKVESMDRLINTPSTKDFSVSVELEAAHQVLRWPSQRDAGKTDADWFWLVGYLAGKVLSAPNYEKKLHHIITTAAVCLNWHRHVTGEITEMRPGIEPPAGMALPSTEGDAR